FQGYRGTVNDVTAEVEQRQSALRAQIRLNEAIETMPAAFMLFDADDRLVLWNTQALAVFRSARAHFTAGASYFQILPPEFSTPNDPGGVRSLQRVPQSRIGRPRDIVNDEGRWLRVIEHQTNEGGIVCVVSDVTELKNREDEAQSARDIAEQANIAKTRFLAAASHDLRQPVHAFGLLLTSLSRRVHDDEAKTLIDRMEKSLESLQGMFNALLDMSRLDAGVMTPEVQEFPIDGILRVLENDLAPLAREKGLEFRCRYSGRYVRSDPMLLERILRNLLSNAIRYTQEGRVFIGARVRDEALRIEVRDSGIGIDAADMQEVFREFHRLGKSVRESRIGLGLGLSIVDRLAQLLGHRLDVQSVVGRGSTFSIEVPLGSMHQQDLGGEGIETISDDALLGLQVAVLDDEPLALEGMVQILSDWGCEIHAAGTVQEFVAGLRSSDNLMGLEPDLLIVDFALGFRETGLVAVEEARKLLGHSIPAVVVTGSTDPDSLAEIRGSGHQLLTKPVTAQQLREMIVRLVAPT
ncbi:MAG: ATP-binding protein, partial [Pseudomonadota bacterium]